MERFVGIIGIISIFLMCYALSNNRKAINYRTVFVGFALQVAMAIFIFVFKPGRDLFILIGKFIEKIIHFAYEGGNFVFGPLLNHTGHVGMAAGDLRIFALQLICSTIFMMVLVNILYYYGIMQRVVAALGKAMNKIVSLKNIIWRTLWLNTEEVA